MDSSPRATTLSHRARVMSALARTGYDRLPFRYQAEPVVNQALMKHLGVSDYNSMLDCLGDDLRYVQATYAGPPLHVYPDGSREIGWPAKSWPVPVRWIEVSYGVGAYIEPLYRPFEDIEDPADLAKFDFPTADWLDYSSIRSQCEKFDGFAMATGTSGVLDFMNGIAHARGIERVLLDVAVEDPVFLALMEKRFEFHYRMIERTLQAAGGLIDIVQAGEDLGTQGGLLVSPKKFDRLFAPKYRTFFDMVHSYGARVMMHSCGSVRDILPKLIDLGLDILDVVQVSAARMGIRGLAADFGRDINFCGTMCVQTILPNSSPSEVKREVELRRELFPDGGLILGPTHLIQPDSPLENILAMYEAAREPAS